ncbi:MAG TPA: hypothetical protein PKV92_07465 [Thermodesulfovibrio thiophilus]|nr:hypothetical protein [Thermodesulfovibrio thiophilus]HQD36914.1 hypothetical protein [Thermodesulfovibrio thiophilus]
MPDILKVVKYLVKKNRIPFRFVSNPDGYITEDSINTLFASLGSLEEKMRKIVDMCLTNDKAVTIALSGQDSIAKDKVAVAFAILFALRGRKVIYYPSPNNLHDYFYYTAIMKLSIRKSYEDIIRLNSMISAILCQKKVLLVGVDDIDNLVSYVEPQIFQSITTQSMWEIPIVSKTLPVSLSAKAEIYV